MKKGFSLIELLVVIVIIGILATIAIAQFKRYIQKSHDTERRTAVAQARQIITADYAATENQSFLNYDTQTEIEVLFAKQGFFLEGAPNHNYYMAIDSIGSGSKFVVAVCGELDPTEVIFAGAPKGDLVCNTNTGVITSVSDWPSITAITSF